MQEIDAIQNKRESKIISSINNDTSENGYIVFDYREKSGYRNFDTQDWTKLIKTKIFCTFFYLNTQNQVPKTDRPIIWSIEATDLTL